jgi:hypothetical protein
MWDYVIGGLIGLLIGSAVVAVAINWDKIAQRVRSWLVRHNLEKSMVQKAFAVIDKIMVRGQKAIRVILKIETKKGKTHVVEEEVVLDGTEQFRSFEEELGGARHKERDLTYAL